MLRINEHFQYVKLLSSFCHESEKTVHDHPRNDAQKRAEGGQKSHDKNEDKRHGEPVLAAGRPEHFGHVLCRGVPPGPLEGAREEQVEGQRRPQAREGAQYRADDDCFLESFITHKHLVNSRQQTAYGSPIFYSVRADHRSRRRAAIRPPQTFKIVITTIVGGVLGAIWLGFKVMLGK